MTFGDFKNFVAASLQRNTTDFVQGTVDLLALAINMARKNIERKRDFELAKDTADLVMTVGSSSDLANAKYAGTATAIDIKTILRAQLSVNAGVTYFPIKYISRANHMRRVARYYEDLASIDEVTGIQPTTVNRFQLVRYGNEVYLSPSDSDAYGAGASLKVQLDVVRWLDDYVEAGDTDFLLTQCVDYMLLETYQSMQLFIKEDARLNVSDEKLARAWHAVLAWDSNLVLGDADDNDMN